MQTDAPAPELMTVKEVARAWRCDVATVYRAIQSGALHAARLRDEGSWRIPRSELEARVRPALKGEE
jgi:excisionase family DNA binding protein